MVRMLKKFGNTQALVIDKSLREQLGIDENTPLETVVRDGSLIVSPVHIGVSGDELDDAVKQVRAEYGEMLKRLA
ncbi:MAG: AbrB/MazE/SpoVT family DNA-binding domain-containing protein [Planctomycetota bacterium]